MSDPSARTGRAQAFRHILVPVSGEPDDEPLVRAAARLAQVHKARLSVVYVVEVPMELPEDAEDVPGARKADEVLNQMEKVAGIDLDPVVLQAREPGQAIVEQAIDSAADLIFMGVHVRERMGVLTLGKTATYVLRHAPCTVWVCRWVAPGAGEKG
jgi:nucleotide-binding universal stress UspA family protein